ncbi:MAG TPA: hypothetical protein V6C65_26280 [Allocoleopsis sp.]
MSEELRMPISELMKHLADISTIHGDLDISITLPGWLIGSEDPEGQQHSWEFGIYVLELTHQEADGTTRKEKIASLGHVNDFEENGTKRHLKLIK